MTDELQSRGYRTLEPTNVVPGYGPKDVTEVFYLPGFEAQGQDVANVLGVQAAPMPATKPVSDTDFVGATVLVGSRPAQYREDPVTVALGIRQSLQHHHGATVAGDESVCRRIEGVAPSGR